ncbi:MAG: NADH-quinone oxidoreductase subunit H [Candidatus Omnitrophica bacterium]|nr:NADH-quinone oxidoreductase subunit H [Candidatus Omnitrophota bacterium]
MKLLFNFLIFPGFLFSVIVGLMACWVDRKVSARLQWRVGPPWYQNFVDIIKLWGKETIVPEDAKVTFLFAPYIGLLSLVLVATILGRALIWPQSGFSADLIVVFYLLAIPAISLIIGSSSSRNPLASVGASREMKLVLSYELPFILSIIAVIIKSGGAIQLETILNSQSLFKSHIASLSGTLAFAVAIFCAMGKSGLGPFEISEAEQEIMGGTLIEYSGVPLSVFKLNKALMLYVMPVFLTMLFLGKDLSPVFMSLKFVMILVIFILVKNTNPRMRIDQAMRFFWIYMTIPAVLAVALAVFGL